MVGRRIGRFVVQSLLGKGGMGSVWRAEDTLLGRAVAIKILSDELAQGDESRRRFRREGEIAAQLDHPGICTVYEAGAQDGLAWLAMACIDGVTLSEKILERLMPIDEVLRVGRMAADALAHAHARDVLHRDVSSRNIMLARDGRVVLLDFGLAIVSDASRITGPGAVVGTIAYMAPELLCGQNASPQSDLYGLGVVLYEMLTGARPFHSENAEALRYLVLQETPEPVRALRPEVPEALEAVVMKAMARQVEDRYADAEEMLKALKGCEGEPGAGAPRAEAAPQSSVLPSSAPSRSTHVDSAARTAPIMGSSKSTVRDMGARVAAGALPVYLGVLPVEDAEGLQDPHRTLVLEDLTEAARATLARIGRVQVIRLEGRADDLRTEARRAGANLTLKSNARGSGPALRVTFSLVDPETGATVAGGAVDGSLLEPFRLEDRFVEAVGAALGLQARGSAGRARRADPAAQDRLTIALANMRRSDQDASLDGAVRILEELAETGEPSASVFAALARACVSKYRLTHQRAWESRALSACERALALAPEAPEVRLALAETHLVAGRPGPALDELAAIADDHPLAFDVALTRARALDAGDRPDEAEEAAHAAIQRRPDDWRGHHVLGLSLFRVGRYEEAAAAWVRATQLCPDNAAAHRNLGSALFHQDRHDEAIAAFRRANELRPDVKAYYNLGTVLFHQGRHEEAVETFESAVALNPSDAVAWGNLGNMCHFIPGREARKREALQHAIALFHARMDGSHPTAEELARLAGWLANLGRSDEARDSLGRALAISPHDVHCMVAAANIHLQLGDRDRCLRWVRRAVAAGYGAESLRCSPELETLRGDPVFEDILDTGAPSRGA